ncbi:MAG: N-acetylmuramoyl-L-alanine amidase [Alphaproteobacteria bacterium]|nr:N-acetylmuramoyl-L-alanine amidase [Alphaproteobacteria bacterium]
MLYTYKIGLLGVRMQGLWLKLRSFAFVCLIILGTILSIAECYAAKISGMRVGQGVGSVRIVFDADSKFDYKVFTLSEPNRLVIDTQGVEVSSAVANNRDENVFVKNVRLGSAGVSGIRIVFDLQKPVLVKKAFILPPQSNFNWRFAIDLEAASERDFVSRLGNSHAISSDDYNSADVVTRKVENQPSVNKVAQSKRKVIVIDAGHGGVDPGAIGYRGTYEKNITLSMSKELKEKLDKNSKYKVYLTRNRDVFIPLRDRVKIARKYDADLFISIHADSARNRKAVGLSVYTLSETASDKEAAALAEKENKADIVAGLNFAEHSKEVSDILLNLAQRETNNSSSEFATLLSGQMSKIVKTVSNTHRFAGFAVLKAPDVPSVLLELGYLSNPTEERQLRQKSYRNKLADAAVKAIDKYFQNPKH